MTERDLRKLQLIQFLNSIRRAGRSLDMDDEQRPLIRSGFIDSLGVLEIIAFLESGFGINLGVRGINPGELATVTSILDLIEAETTKLVGACQE